MATVETNAGDFFVSANFAKRESEEWGDYMKVRMHVRACDVARYVDGYACVTTLGEAMGDSRDSWLSSNIIKFLDEEVPEENAQRSVLDAIEREAAIEARDR